ncbi:MAG: hypothetical protein HY660_05725, partial [Armatimonadetes bacterium]|nr:hypothetical protein [Armatimonadota bacterium]
VAVWCSADRGNTWTELARPHAHPLSHQIMPARAAANGKLSAGWYDSRGEPAYTPDGPVSGAGGAPGPGFGIDVFYNQRTSANCTAGWEGERRVTSQSFNPNLYASSTATRPFIGDYKGLAVDDRNVYVAWTDNRDINAAANALEDGTSSTNPPEIINLRSRDSNIYFKTFAK